MKTKIVGILVVSLLVTTVVFPVLGTMNNEYETVSCMMTTTGPIPPPDCGKDVDPSLLSNSKVIIDGVPSYTWYNGCSPTSVGMLMGYWDGHGYGRLVSGLASTQTSSVNFMISSRDNYADYCLPIDTKDYIIPDKSEPPVGDEHTDNCVADFIKTSQSYYNSHYGSTRVSDIDDGISAYVSMKHPEAVAKTQGYSIIDTDSSWMNYCKEIDANQPVILNVDSDGDGINDHSILGIGYDDNVGKRRYGCYNTWDTSIHWYDWNDLKSGTKWGIYNCITCFFKSAPSKPSKPTGTVNGKAENSYEYITSTTDDDHDSIQYGWNWTGGFTVDEWTSYYNSGETCAISHSWEEGSYQIRVIAHDIDGGKSEWSDPLYISMPKNKPINTLLFNFLENHPHMFLLLRQLFGL